MTTTTKIAGEDMTDEQIRKSMTGEQIRLERKLTCEAIDGAMAFGYQNTNPPPSDDHWLAPYWKIGRKQAEMEFALLESKPAVPADDVIDLAVALEQRRALHIVAAVRQQGFSKSGTAIPTQAESVFDLACEEIEHRLRTETWELVGVTGPLPTAPAQSCGDAEQADEAVTGGAVDSGHVDALEWHWSTSDEGPMYACGTDDVTESLAHALYESGIATFGEDQTSIFLCRFRPLKIDWKHHAEWLLEHIDDTAIDHVAEDAVPTEKTDVDELSTALASIVKVDASVAYDQCEFAPGDEKYETALLRVRNDAARAKDSK
jgi:hypothetical protein